MRFRLKPALVAATCFALVATPAALGFEGADYSGGVRGQPTSIFDFDVDRTASGHSVVSRMVMGRIAYTCDSAPAGSSGGYTSNEKFRIRNGKWSGKQNITESGFDPVLTVTGKVLGDGEAKGTVRLRGTLDPSNPDAKCDTGTVHWKASRTAQPG
jgi:hypothetical protein